MKAIVLLSVLVVLIPAPTLAASRHTQAQPHQSQQSTDSNASKAKDPYGVYIEGQEIGRDPDPNIRDELGREYYWQG